MEIVEAYGIVIDIQRDNENNIRSLDIFTIGYGIMRWFGKDIRNNSEDFLFEDVNICGRKTTKTAGQIDSVELLSDNSSKMKQNNSYKFAATFVDILRKNVYDGVPLDNLFVITKQAIRNFVANHDARIVLLKALYLLCREEGYAVDSIWMNSLLEEDKILAKNIITAGLHSAAPKRISAIINSLARWISSI